MANKVITGTKDLKNYQVLKGQSDTRQIRCPTCHELAVQVPDGKGEFVYECAGCRRRFSHTRI